MSALPGCKDKAAAPTQAKTQEEPLASNTAAETAEDEPEPQVAQSQPRATYAGSIEVELAGTRKQFDHVLAEKTHLIDSGAMKSVVLLVRSGDEGREQLGVAIRGHNLSKVVGKDLSTIRRGRSKMPKGASAFYVDEEGTRFVANPGKDESFELRITSYDPGRSIEGEFSGTLTERKGERTVEVQGGTFSMRLESSDG